MPVSNEALASGIDMMSSELKNAPEFTPKKFATWAELLVDWTDEAFLKAVHKACTSLTFFPTLGELRNAAGGSKEDAAVDRDEAWELVRSAIRRHGKHASFCAADVNGDQAALWAVARMGAESIGMMTDEDRAIKAAEFRRLYAVAKTRNYGLEYLAGKYETDNRARGLDIGNDPALLGRSDMPQTAPALEGPAERGLVHLGGVGN